VFVRSVVPVCLVCIHSTAFCLSVDSQCTAFLLSLLLLWLFGPLFVSPSFQIITTLTIISIIFIFINIDIIRTHDWYLPFASVSCPVSVPSFSSLIIFLIILLLLLFFFFLFVICLHLVCFLFLSDSSLETGYFTWFCRWFFSSFCWGSWISGGHWLLNEDPDLLRITKLK